MVEKRIVALVVFGVMLIMYVIHRLYFDNKEENGDN